MHAFTITVSAISVAIWLYLLAARGNYFRVTVEPATPAEGVRVTAIVPARNEAELVERSIASLLRQKHAHMRVVLVDDASGDGTAEVARVAADRTGRGDRLTVLRGAALPNGWTGKMWAVQQGIERAGNAELLLLTDADVEHGPETVATLAAIAQRGEFDLASYMVKLRCESWAERLLIPAFVYFFFQLYPPAWIADPKSKTAGAAGGCMLVRAEALRRAGGAERIRREIIDDCALARAVKESGGRVWLGVTETSHSLRAYGSFAEIGNMIARTAFQQLRHSALLLAATIAGLLLTYVAPVVLAASGQHTAMLAGGAAWAAMTVSYLPMVRFYRLNPLWALTMPLAAVFYMGVTCWSAVQYWRGRGGHWKGRAQDSMRAAMR